MASRVRSFLLGMLGVVLLATLPAGAQSPGGPAYSQDELDQLLAPIALYPDQLLSQILIASTYPLEIVQAARFVQQNPGLAGEALDQALSERRWDPSIQSLAAFPQVLAMMNDKLDWTQRLGDAFLADEARVMDTVQSLRQRAAAVGSLQSTPQQAVIDQGGEIAIQPAQPDLIYVPAYDPMIAYGPWWAPAYPPWFWYPESIYGYPAGAYLGAGIIFGSAWAITHDHWGWAHPDWHGHRITVNAGSNRFWNRPGHPPPVSGGAWQHTPEHRRGVAYPDPAMRERFNRVDPGAVHARQNFRGYDLASPSPQGVRPGYGAARPAPQVTQPTRNAPQVTRTPPRQAPPTFDPGVSRQQAQMNSQRGMQSRQSSGGSVSPSTRAPSGAPAPHGGDARKR